MQHTIDIYRAGKLIATLPESATVRDLEALRTSLVDAGEIPPDSFLKVRRFERARPAHV